MYVTFFGSVRPISDLYALGGGGSCRISKTCILTIFKMYVTFLGSPPSKAVGMSPTNFWFEETASIVSEPEGDAPVEDGGEVEGS